MERTSRSRRPRLRRAPNQLRGNGSLMRTTPVALAHLGDDHAIARSAVDVSALTHGDPLAGEACVLWCIGIDRAVREGRLDGVRDGLALLESSSARRIERSFLVRSERLRRASPASRVRGHPADADPGRHALPSSPARVAGGGADRPRHRHRGRDRGGPAGGAMGRLRRALRWRGLLHGWPSYEARDLIRLGVLSARESPTAPTDPPVCRQPDLDCLRSSP